MVRPHKYQSRRNFVILETIMGVEVGTQKGELFLFKRLDRILEITYLRQYSIWYHLDFMFKWTQLHKENVRLIGELNRFTEELINKKRVQVSTGCTPNRKSLLDLLLESSAEKLTTDEIKDEMQTFIIAVSMSTVITLGLNLSTGVGHHSRHCLLHSSDVGDAPTDPEPGSGRN